MRRDQPGGRGLLLGVRVQHPPGGRDRRRDYLDGGNGSDLSVDWDDSGLHDETITMIGWNGGDELVSEDLNSTVDMVGGNGNDSCQGGDTTSGCETVF